MGFGALICAADHLPGVNQALAELKERHRARGELKWEKVSPSRGDFYSGLRDASDPPAAQIRPGQIFLYYMKMKAG